MDGENSLRSKCPKLMICPGKLVRKGGEEIKGWGGRAFLVLYFSVIMLTAYHKGCTVEQLAEYYWSLRLVHCKSGHFKK
jgi:hypothetical protein